MTEVMQHKVVGTTGVVNPHPEQRECSGVPRAWLHALVFYMRKQIAEK